jgi:hypothetical protein
MNSYKSLWLLLTGIIAIAVLLITIRMLVKKINNKTNEKGHFFYSYSIWIATIFLSGSLIMYKAISILNEAIDNINKLPTINILKEITKTAILFVGMGGIWLIVLIGISNTLTSLLTSKRNVVLEMESDNKGFFIIRGMIIIGSSIILLPAQEELLRLFIPAFQLPFYH